jgi:hypothetical protein
MLQLSYKIDLTAPAQSISFVLVQSCCPIGMGNIPRQKGIICHPRSVLRNWICDLVLVSGIIESWNILRSVKLLYIIISEFVTTKKTWSYWKVVGSRPLIRLSTCLLEIAILLEGNPLVHYFFYYKFIPPMSVWYILFIYIHNVVLKVILSLVY